MKILFIAPAIPNRFHRIRAYHLLKVLAKTHEVHLLCLSHSRSEEVSSELAGLCASVRIVRKSKARALLDCLASLPTSTPLEVAYCRSSEMKKAAEEIALSKNIELAYVKRLRIAESAAALDMPTVLDATDAMSLFYGIMRSRGQFHKRLFYVLEYAKYAAYERKISKRIRNWVVCSDMDGKYLRTKLPSVVVSIVPNTVDLDYYHPQNISEIPKRIMFSGLMDKWVNIDASVFFAQKIMCLVRRKTEGAGLIIVGPNPAAAVKKLAAPDIVVMGKVEDIRQEIAKASIVVCPVRVGTGTRNKILQAWALGRAVVSTYEGAAGLLAENGSNIILAGTEESFADAVVRLCMDDILRKKLAAGGLETARRHYSNDVLARSLQKLLDDMGTRR